MSTCVFSASRLSSGARILPQTLHRRKGLSSNFANASSCSVPVAVKLIDGRKLVQAAARGVSVNQLAFCLHDIGMTAHQLRRQHRGQRQRDNMIHVGAANHAAGIAPTRIGCATRFPAR